MSANSLIEGYLASLSIGTSVEGDPIDTEMVARMICEEGTAAQRQRVYRILFEKRMDGLIAPMKQAARVADGIKALSAGRDAMLQAIDEEAVARAALAEAQQHQRTRILEILRDKGKGLLADRLDLETFPATAASRPGSQGGFHGGRGMAHAPAEGVSEADRA